jgi:hypothetical protein
MPEARYFWPSLPFGENFELILWTLVSLIFPPDFFSISNDLQESGCNTYAGKKGSKPCLC